MTLSLAFVCGLAGAYAGMAALSLAMDRHAEQVHGRSPRAAWRGALRLLGALLLALAAVPCVRAWGASVGVVVWLGLLSAGALLLVLLLPYAPRAVRPLAWASVAVFAAVLGLSPA
jgi:hypothetical protein